MVGLRRRAQGRGAARGLGRPHPCALPHRVAAEPGAARRQRLPAPLVPPRVPRAAARQRPAAAAFRRGGLGRHGVRERHARRRARRRLRPVHVRRDRRAQARRAAGPRGERVGPDRPRPAAPRQAGPEAPEHLVHGGDRHLADGVARAGAAGARGRPGRHARPRRRRGARERRRRRRRAGARHEGPGARRHQACRVRRRPVRQHRDDPDRAPASLVAQPSLPLWSRGAARGRRPDHELLRHAEDLRPARQRRRQSPVPQRPPAVRVRHARPGLVARRALHRAHRRRHPLRPHDAEAARLQPDPQAREGRAGALVHLVRPARPPRLAGHAQRQQRHARGPAGVRGRAAAGRGRAAQPSGHRDVGAVQRGMGPARHRALRGLAQAARSLAPGGRRERLDRPERRRRDGRARLPRPRDARAGSRPGGGPGRIRGPGAAGAGPFVDRARRAGATGASPAPIRCGRGIAPCSPGCARSSPTDSRPRCTRRRPTSRSKSTG